MSTETTLIRDSFALLSPKAPELATRFYEILFERHPDVRTLFAHVRFDEQKKRFLRSVAIIVRHIDDVTYLRAYLGGLGLMHVAYGARPELYPPVGECLIAALQATAGKAWTPALTRAWGAAYGTITDLMLVGASHALAETQAKAPRAKARASRKV